MKIRSGFVSNSSSSSFVCVGIPLENYPALMDKFWDNDDHDLKKNIGLPENTSCEHHEGTGLVLGWILAYGSTEDGSFTCKEVDFDLLQKYSVEFEKITGVKPKLMGGTYAL